MKDLDTDFYLSGGTALSRGYFKHRFSDDLDYFTNANQKFTDNVRLFINAVKKNDKTNLSDQYNQQITDHFARFFLEKQENKNRVILNIDFVNDIEAYFGTVYNHPKLGRIDNPENILINKITALTRFEPKDIADVWIISKNKSFNWKMIFQEAKKKDMGISVEEAAGIIKNFPQKYLEKIRWAYEINQESFFEDLTTISRELLTGADNSIYS